MTAEEAEEQPAGKGRDEPDALPEPKYALAVAAHIANFLRHCIDFRMCKIKITISRKQ